MWRYIVAALLAGLACDLIFPRFASLSQAPGVPGAMERILLMSISFLILYLGTIVILYRGFSPLKRLTGLLREMAPAVEVQRH